MDMDHLIGQRFNLISKSEIRYVGTLHEINPEQSTIALEDVYSYGTEGRPSDNFISASNQKFDYIVFRGSDVKDIKVVEERKENHQPESNVPNDPAILNASRPGQASPGVSVRNTFQPGFAPPPNFQNASYYSPFNPNFRPTGPPGQNHPGMMYQPPPPGYFGPPGGFAPTGSPFPPPMPPGQPGPPGQRPLSDQEPNELPVNDRGHASGDMRSSSRVSTVSPNPGPTPPNESKPSVSEALAPVANAPTSAPLSLLQSKKPTAKSNFVAPALPLLVNNRSNAPLISAATKPAMSGNPKTVDTAPTQIAVEEANRRARAAVANAMAKMSNMQPTQTPTAHPKPTAVGNPVDMLTQKVVEMKVADSRGEYRGRGNPRGRGHRGAHQGRAVEIPKSDYDFESANARFNKEDMIKEAIASGSPITESGAESASLEAISATNGDKRKDSLTAEVYNKSSSFFDNLSSELKDREEGNPGNRMARGQEIKKNVETFGQGSVDAGFRGRGRGFRGRGRGYAGYGYNQRGYGYARGGAGGAGGGRGRGQTEQGQAPPSSAR